MEVYNKFLLGFAAVCACRDIYVYVRYGIFFGFI